MSKTDDVDRTSPSESHPVAFGLLALVGVGLAIGLVAALGALMASKAVVGGGEDASNAATQKQSMYLPTPTPTAKDGGPGPLVSLKPQEKGKGKKKGNGQRTAINLTAGQTSVSPMERIDLTGTYDSEGAILQVQRFADGAWGDFPVTVSVSGGQFRTYVQTSSSGTVKFRVVDTDTQAQSNEVSVQIG